MEKTLTIGEIIDRAITAEGRKQSWVVQRMNEDGCNINEVQFSRKKNGRDEFTKQEIELLEAILNITQW
jgi:hypothetical protein